VAALFFYMSASFGINRKRPLKGYQRLLIALQPIERFPLGVPEVGHLRVKRERSVNGRQRLDVVFGGNER